MSDSISQLRNMNVNPLKKIWKDGGSALGTYIMYSRDIATVEIAAAAGLNFIVFDLEHRPHDYKTIHDLSQVARLLGMASLVGPQDISPSAISHVLDMGASGVIIPHVETTEDVAIAIEAVHYPPKGKRGRCSMAGHNLYNGTRSLPEEVAHYNSDVALLLKVESESAIQRLEDLVAPEDIDGVIVGPVDLSLDMGIPGQTNHEDILKLIDHVREVCRKKNIQFGTYVKSPEDIAGAIKSGATWVIVGSEMEAMAKFWKSTNQAKCSRQ